MKPTPSIRELFEQTRSRTEVLCQPLEKEDFVVQPVEYVSPPKWHLGHTSWFFEEFILKKRVANYREFDRQYGYVFNSYYESFGKRVVRTDRGNLSRPTVDQIMDYRAHITHAILDLLASDDDPELRELVELGIHHEMQHQELLITDVKFILGHNPLLPVYNPDYKEDADQLSQKDDYINIEEGIYEIGHANPQEFHYDNERGRHKVYLNAFPLLYPAPLTVRPRCSTASSGRRRRGGEMKRCMFVDDSSVIRKVAKRILGGPDMLVIEAESGHEALRMCAADMPDILVVDSTLDDMETVDLIRSVRSLSTLTPPQILISLVEVDIGPTQTIADSGEGYKNKADCLHPTSSGACLQAHREKKNQSTASSSDR